MSKHQEKKFIFFSIFAVFILIVISFSAYVIQREIKWRETRKVMDLNEQEILQKIVISENERLPKKMIEDLMTSIMEDTSETEIENCQAFTVLTQNFIEGINKELNISLDANDLDEKNAFNKTEYEKYGNELEIAYYQFNLGDATYAYAYYENNRVVKTIRKGIVRENRVSIVNENNQSLYPLYSEWKSKATGYFGKKVSMSDYKKLFQKWKSGNLPKDVKLTIKNILEVHKY